MIIEFYYHWDREKKKARLLFGHIEYFVDCVYCAVPTITKQNEEFPHFVVSGKCTECVITNAVAILK